MIAYIGMMIAVVISSSTVAERSRKLLIKGAIRKAVMAPNTL